MTADPWRVYPTEALADDDSACVLDDAVETLVVLRSPMSSGDAGAECMR